MNTSGSLRLYIGCMYSGKTSELIREYTRYQKIGKRVICINYSLDTRYGNDNFVYSHNLAKIECLKATFLMKLSMKELLEYDVILINEGQFFTDLLDFCLLYCDTHKKHIIVCGLDGDFNRKPFGQISDLIPLADEVTKLKALCEICNDGTSALFSYRISDSKEQISIDNNYIPLCRKHYLEKKNSEPIDTSLNKSPSGFELNYLI